MIFFFQKLGEDDWEEKKGLCWLWVATAEPTGVQGAIISVAREDVHTVSAWSSASLQLSGCLYTEMSAQVPSNSSMDRQTDTHSPLYPLHQEQGQHPSLSKLPRLGQPAMSRDIPSALSQTRVINRKSKTNTNHASVKLQGSNSELCTVEHYFIMPMKATASSRRASPRAVPR